MALSTGKILVIGVAGYFFLSMTKKKKKPLAAGMMGEFFTWNEFVHTSVNEPNQPDVHEWENGVALAFYVLDPLRRIMGGPIRINSWFRSPEVNAAIGGASHSTHMTGGTADISFFLDGVERNDLIVAALYNNNIPFDRCIIEKGTWQRPAWIHIEYNNNKPATEQRRSFMHIDYNGTKYADLAYIKQIYNL